MGKIVGDYRQQRKKFGKRCQHLSNTCQEAKKHVVSCGFECTFQSKQQTLFYNQVNQATLLIKSKENLRFFLEKRLWFRTKIKFAIKH